MKRADSYRDNSWTDPRGVVRGCVDTSARPASTSSEAVILDIYCWYTPSVVGPGRTLYGKSQEIFAKQPWTGICDRVCRENTRQGPWPISIRGLLRLRVI